MLQQNELMKSQWVKTCLKVSGKTKEAKEKLDSFVLIERFWTNCHLMKTKIKRTTSSLKRAASCAFAVNLEQAMVPLKKAE